MSTSNKSKPIFENLFTWSGRRNRKSYIFQQLAFIGIIIAGVVLAGVVALVVPVLGGLIYFATVIVGIALLVATVASIAQRIRDVGYPGWLAVILLVPFVNLAVQVALAVAPSQEGDNRYGPSQI
jgi:uncharacterized membrane protein YhaH (DUF805 family)